MTICVGLRLVMSATSAPANAGLAADQPPSRTDSPIASPTSPQPVAAAARPATSRPKAVLGEHRPRGRRAHVGHDGVGDVLGDARPGQHDDAIRAAVGPRVRPGVARAQGVDLCADVATETCGATEQLTRHLGATRFHEHGDGAGGGSPTLPGAVHVGGGRGRGRRPRRAVVQHARPAGGSRTAACT